MQILIIRPGNAITPVRDAFGDFDAWFRERLGLDAAQTPCVSPQQPGAILPDPARPDAVIVTGSASMVTDDATWLDGLRDWLREFVASGRPTLGVCFGHQLLAQVLGGEVGYNADGVHIGSVQLETTEDGREDPLLSGLRAPFTAHLSHEQSIRRMPDGARILARHPRDPHAAFAFGDSVWGVQFHPEFSADVTRGYVQERAEKLREAGHDPEAAMAGVRDDEGAGATILGNFRDLVTQRR